MKLDRVRLTIFALWLGGMAAAILEAMLAPWLRTDEQIGAEQILSIVPAVMWMFLPGIACLVGFWFPTREKSRARTGRLDRTRAIAAITLTMLYVAGVLVAALWPLYWNDYGRSTDLVAGESLTERIAGVTSLAALLSPLALAPVTYLTSDRIERRPAARSTTRRAHVAHRPPRVKSRGEGTTRSPGQKRPKPREIPNRG